LIQGSSIGRDHPSVCESPAAIERITSPPLPRIDEECASVFSGSITNEEMLDTISGNTSLCRNSSEFIVDSGFDTDRDRDHTNKTLPGPEHYMLEDKMVHATSNRAIQEATMTNTDEEIVRCHISISCSNDNDSVLSMLTSSDYGSESVTEVEFPDHYAAIKLDTTLTVSNNQMSNKAKEILKDQQYSDYCATFKQDEDGIKNDDNSSPHHNDLV